MPEPGEASLPLAKGLSLAAALVVGLALERCKPHERLQPAWGTNLGLFAVGSLVTALVCGACGWVVAAWGTEHRIGLLAWLGAGPWLAAGAGLLGLDAVAYLWHRANHRLHFSGASTRSTTGTRASTSPPRCASTRESCSSRCRFASRRS